MNMTRPVETSIQAVSPPSIFTSAGGVSAGVGLVGSGDLGGSLAKARAGPSQRTRSSASQGEVRLRVTRWFPPATRKENLAVRVELAPRVYDGGRSINPFTIATEMP